VGAYEEAFARWRRLRARNPEAVTGIDLYQLVAAPRGLRADELPRQERLELAGMAMAEIWPGHSLVPDAERGYEPIEVVTYDDRWPAIFDRWKRNLLDALGASTRVEHVGSTSVPGLEAKPIVDIQVSVPDLDHESSYVAKIQSLGVRLRSRDEYHRYFHPLAGRRREVHIHVCPVGSKWERDHLLFVAYLRHNAAARDSYAAAKREAGSKWRDDRFAYTEAKSAAILAIMARAEAWASASGWSP
jgi:GrpB-like predicted nucleotidyltransferase (UPF0157 family)